MLKKLLPTVLAGLLLSSNSAIAAQDMTFARWVAACSLLSDSTLQTVDAGTCLGYTQGVLDAAHLAEPEQEALFCDPRDTVVVRDYVELGQKWPSSFICPVTRRRRTCSAAATTQRRYRLRPGTA